MISNSKNGRERSEYELYVDYRSKTADFATYYNIAFEHLNHLKKLLQSRNWPNAVLYSYLAEYLWKSHKEQKNNRGYEINERDIRLIKKMCLKLEQIRNYHAHIWHDHAALICDGELKKFIEEKYQQALAMLAIEDPMGVADFEHLQREKQYRHFNLFESHGHEQYFTTEGRVFFLSFFLSTGQMSQFLQQRRGSKRTDMPLFRIKHKLYKYYCHRDGAALFNFHQEDTVFSTLPWQEQRQILQARTAYKLITYLHDYPTYWGDHDNMPLYLYHDGQPIVAKDMAALGEFIKANPGLLPGFTFQVPSQNDTTGAISTAQPGKTNHIHFMHTSLPGYYFEIGFAALHRLITLTLLHQHQPDFPSPIDTLLTNLSNIANIRRSLYHILSKRPAERNDEEMAFLLDRKHQYLRGSRWLTEKGIIFFEQLEKKKREKEKEALDIAAAISPSDTYLPDEKAREPIIVYQQDMVSTTERKFRPGNRFTYYAAKFLIDFAGDGWYWGMETFEMDRKSKNAHESLVKKKAYFKASEIPANYRLTLEDEHIYIALPKDNNAEKNHDKFYQFTIGPQAMKYLMAYCCCPTSDDYREKIRSFLENLKTDLEKIRQEGGWRPTTSYLLLDETFVPAYLKPAATASWQDIDRKIENRIHHIIQHWEQVIATLPLLKRAEKNHIVMNAYRLFEWPIGADGNPKFFRQQEYNYMSICHYCLQEKKDHPIVPEGYLPKQAFRERKKNKFIRLFTETFGLSTRQPSIPAAIITLLNNSDSLDTLLIKVIDDRAVFLKKRLSQLKSLSKQQLKAERKTLSQLLGISIPLALQSDDHQAALQSKREKTREVLPIPIHPMLVVKYFHPDRFAKGKEDFRLATNHHGEIKLHPAHNIFSNLRKNPILRKGLYEPHYDLQIAESLYAESEKAKSKKKLIGLINDTLTEDIILWWMAKQYLNENSFTQTMGKQLRQRETDGYHVGNLHNTFVTLPLKNAGGKSEAPKSPDLYATALMHQLDDMMFHTQHNYLRRAAVHYRNRCMSERQIWTDAELFEDKLKEVGVFPDGTINSPISFDILRDEINLVRRTGQKFAEAIFRFEHLVLDTAAQKMFNGDYLQLHKYLKAQFGAPSSGNFYHLNFKKVIELSEQINREGLEEIKTVLDKEDYRNIALHNDIPLNMGSFSWVTREGSPLRSALEVTEDLHAKKDYSIYQVS